MMKKRQFITKVYSLITFCLLSNLSFSQVGAVSTLAGSASGNSDGLGTAALLNKPYGVCISNDGNFLYFTDTYNHLVRKVDLTTTQVTTIAGTGNTGATNGLGINAQFNYPKGICISSDDQFLYVADTDNNKIRKINLLTNMVSTFAGSGVMGGTGNAKGHLATFNLPEGLVINSNNTYLYVADAGNHTIRKIDLVSDSMVTIAAGDGGATGGGYLNASSATAKFKNPRGLCISPDGTVLYIGDNNNHCIRKLDFVSNQVTTYAGVGGSASSGSDNGSLVSAKFSNPAGITMSSNGKFIYVADNSNLLIRQISVLDNLVTTLAGSLLWGYVDDADGTKAKFASPIDVEISRDNQFLYVTDLSNNRIRVVRALLGGTSLVKEIYLDSRAYPNPALEYLFLDIDNQNEVFSMDIIDLNGNIRKEINSKDQKIDVTDLNAGSYFLRMVYKSGLTTNVKFIKM